MMGLIDCFIILLVIDSLTHYVMSSAYVNTQLFAPYDNTKANEKYV